MSNQSYKTTLIVNRTPQQVFDAIINVRAWWPGDIAGDTDKVGDEFTYRYEDLHYSRQRITELIAGERLVWLVLDSTLSFANIKNEWTGTQIVFEIATKGDQTELQFTHEGLVPAFACYRACSNGWDFVINRSLRSLLETGEGQRPEWGRAADAVTRS